MPRQLGAIAAGHQRAAEAGAQMLVQGGNAVDAAVATVFCSCTCEPTLTGIGGAGFATVHMADGRDVVLDFFATAPGINRTVDFVSGPVPVDVLYGATTQTFHVGPQSCAVPGFVRGVLEMHDRFGSLPRAEVLAPGIELARDGLVMTAAQEYCHHILESIVTRREQGRAAFAPDGSMLVQGDRFRQPQLATTLESLARDGADAFYVGEVADAIVEWSDGAGGLISREDLAAYRVCTRTPVRARYRSLELVSLPPPSSGGALVAYALRLLDEARDGQPIDVETLAGAELLVGAMLAANDVRGAEFDRYLYREGGLEQWLLADERIAAGQAVIDGVRVGADPQVRSGSGSTTHVSTVDAAGNAVSMTTSTGCGSGEFAGNTGVHLNNMLGEEDLVPVEHKLVPGDRLTSMMGASILLADGRPRLVTGSAGSNRIRSAILQTLVRAVESRWTHTGQPLQQRLAEATAASRVHAEGGVVHVEPEGMDAVIAGLRAHHDLNVWPAHSLYFGGVNMVAVDDDGSFAAAADPRRGGGRAIAFDDGSVIEP